MTTLDLPVILFQIVLPVGLLAWLILKPARSIFGFVVQILGSGLGLLATALTAIWSMPPWWVPLLYGLLWLLVCAAQSLTLTRRDSMWLPHSPASWVACLVFSALAIYGGSMSLNALSGRSPPSTSVVDLPLPLGPGTYLVANGGASESINAHFLTLEPATDRQRAYRGQSFAVDLLKIDTLGNRASGWRPRNPEAYDIFGEVVFAPCDGIVLSAEDGLPDMPVPVPDRTRLEGNHVFIDCGDYGVLLAHFQSGSVLVRAGDEVQTGDPIAKAGNSGQTFEPHLHIHVQALGGEGPLLSGEPIHLTLNGRFPVRNRRFNGFME